jgi:hypothetical protein
VNPALITGLNYPLGIAVSGGNLFVASGEGPMSELSKIGKYTTSGATVNPSLIPELGLISDIAVSGDKVFVVDYIDNLVAEYTTSGALVNPDLITGLFDPSGIAISGDKLFITSSGTDLNQIATVGEYTTSGVPVNPTLITVPNYPLGAGIAVSGENLFIASFDFSTSTGTIGEYTTSGATANPSLISGLSFAPSIAVVSASAPDASSTWTLLLLGLTATFGLKPCYVGQPEADRYFRPIDSLRLL